MTRQKSLLKVILKGRKAISKTERKGPPKVKPKEKLKHVNFRLFSFEDYNYLFT